MSLVFGAGFCWLLFVMNNRENNPTNETGYAVENSESRLIPPDHPRQLVNFTFQSVGLAFTSISS